MLSALGACAQQSDGATEWIRANAIRLGTAEAGHGFADMQALKPLIGNARIVSLGEATHGTREFFQLKHRMLEFLATEMGFTIFSIEANMPEADRLNDYVLNGTGDPAELLRGMYFWTWDTEEVLEMIRWMRAFNLLGRGRVQFTGFDMQFHQVALINVQRFAARYDPGLLRALHDAGKRIPAGSVQRASSANAPTAGFPIADSGSTVSAEWHEVLSHLEAQRTSYRTQGATAHDIDGAIQNARVVLQAVQNRLGLVSRDRSMAMNVKWLLDQNPDAKIVLWAHNGHVARGRMLFRSMGEELHEMYGAAMVVLGFAFNRGSFQAMSGGGGVMSGNARRPRSFTVGPASKNSFDGLLASAHIPLFVLDLRHAPTPLREVRPTRLIGSAFANEMESQFFARVSAPTVFDAIVFVESTSAARPNVRTSR
jgi:erythromycin esterase